MRATRLDEASSLREQVSVLRAALEAAPLPAYVESEVYRRWYLDTRAKALAGDEAAQ